MWLRTARHLLTFFMPNLEFIHDRVTTLPTTDLKLRIYETLNTVPTSQKTLHLHYNDQSVNTVKGNNRYLL